MRNRELDSRRWKAHESGGARAHESSIPCTEFQGHADGWILECEVARRSQATLSFKRLALRRLQQFASEQGYQRVGKPEILAFLADVGDGNKPRTVQAYFIEIRSFFKYLVAEEVVERCPLEGVPVPTNNPDQVMPFTQEQVAALLKAAKKGSYPTRDDAILLFMLDTAARASEVCALQIQDIDLQSRRALIRDGKGGKARPVFFSGDTAKAIVRYLKIRHVASDAPLFVTERGEPFTRSGLLHLYKRLGKDAGVSAVRCSPHTMRHTSAVTFLRAGGNVFALKTLLGHTNLTMTQKYLALAQADIQEQHRQYSPVEALRGRR